CTARRRATAFPSTAASPRFASTPNRSSANAGRACWGWRAASARWWPTTEFPRKRGKAHRPTGAPKNGEGRMSRIKPVLGFALGAIMLLTGAAQAQGNYPNRPIRIIVPYPAGGIVDIVARAVTEQVG